MLPDGLFPAACELYRFDKDATSIHQGFREAAGPKVYRRYAGPIRCQVHYRVQREIAEGGERPGFDLEVIVRYRDIPALPTPGDLVVVPEHGPVRVEAIRYLGVRAGHPLMVGMGCGRLDEPAAFVLGADVPARLEVR